MMCAVSDDRATIQELAWRRLALCHRIVFFAWAVSFAWMGPFCLGGIPALAAELYNSDGIDLRWDNTIQYSAMFRLNGRDPILLSDPNADDGDRDFPAGFASNRIDLQSEISVFKDGLGFDASAEGWYDSLYDQRNGNNSPATFNPVSVAHNRFTDQTQVQEGRDAELRNAFIQDRFEIAGMPLSLRVGRQTLLWGESLFFPENGIAGGQAPVDQEKQLRVPTDYARNVYLPVTQASASLQLPSGLAIDAYYQFEWRPDRAPAAGSYFSAVDYLDAGGERIILAPGQYFYRADDQKPPPGGQFGAALRFSDGEVDYGLYALRFNAKDPEIYYRPGIAVGSGPPPVITDPGVVNLAIGKVGTYRLVYPQHIELYGASASFYVGDNNVALEISGRRNMPLVSQPLYLAPGQAADGGDNPLYALGDTLHAQASTVTTFARNAVWDSADLQAEIAANYRLDVTRNRAALDPSRSKGAIEFRGTFEPSYYEVLPNLDLTLVLGLGYNLAGKSSINPYEYEATGDVEFGVTAHFRTVWQGSLLLTHYLGDPTDQSFADRDFISLTVQRTF